MAIRYKIRLFVAQAAYGCLGLVSEMSQYTCILRN